MCSSNASLCVKVLTKELHPPVQLNVGPWEGFASNVDCDGCADESVFGGGEGVATKVAVLTA